MVGSIWLEGRMSQKSQSDEQKALEDATSVATEAVVSIKTVQSLGKYTRAVFKISYKQWLLNYEWTYYLVTQDNITSKSRKT